MRGLSSTNRMSTRMPKRLATSANCARPRRVVVNPELVSNSTRWKKTLVSVSTCCSACRMLPPTVSTNSATAWTSPGWSGQDNSRTTRTGFRSRRSVRPAAHCPDPGRDQQRHEQRRAADDRFSLGTFVQAIRFCFARSASRFGLVRSANSSTVVASDARACSISRWISSGDRCTVTPGSFHRCRSPQSLVSSSSV